MAGPRDGDNCGGTNNVIRGTQSSFCAEITAEAQCNLVFLPQT